MDGGDRCPPRLQILARPLAVSVDIHLPRTLLIIPAGQCNASVRIHNRAVFTSLAMTSATNNFTYVWKLGNGYVSTATHSSSYLFHGMSLFSHVVCMESWYTTS